MFLIMGLIGLVLATGPPNPSNKRFGFGLFVVTGIAAVRAVRASSVRVDDDHVTTVGMLRSRRHPISSIVRASVEVGRTGMNGFGRECMFRWH